VTAVGVHWANNLAGKLALTQPPFAPCCCATRSAACERCWRFRCWARAPVGRVLLRYSKPARSLLGTLRSHALPIVLPFVLLIRSAAAHFCAVPHCLFIRDCTALLGVSRRAGNLTRADPPARPPCLCFASPHPNATACYLVCHCCISMLPAGGCCEHRGRK